MTTTQKKEHKFLPYETDLPMPGKITNGTKTTNRHGYAWDLREYDSRGTPPVIIIKQQPNSQV